MLAVKAEYDNGTVRWRRNPPVAGRRHLTVVFEDVDTGGAESGLADPFDAQKKEEAIRALRGFCKNVPDNVSLVDELIAERRREAQRED